MASGQATGIQSPRDSASGQATGSARQAQGIEFTDILISSATAPKPDAQVQQAGAGGTTGTAERRVGPNQPQGYSLSSNTPGSTVVAPQANSSAAGPGATAPNGYLKIEGIDGESKVRASSDISSTARKKPRRNRDGTRGKRQHKP